MSNPIVTILPGNVVANEGQFKNDKGEDVNYSTRKQPAKLETPDGFVYPFDVRLAKDQQPHAPGKYELLLGSMLAVVKGAATIGKYPVLRSIAAAR